MFGPTLLEKARGPGPEVQTEHMFRNALERDYDLVLLGNSRFYRGLNPDQFDVPTYNFSCDMDSYNQMYHKLRWLRENGKKFRYVAIGVDCFQFSFISSKRNFVYGPYLGPEYLADYEPNPHEASKRWRKRFLRGLNPKYLVLAYTNQNRLRSNGQFIKPGTARATDSVRRSTERLPLQLEYFRKMLHDCEEHGSQVFLCMLPLRPEERAAYRDGEIEEFRDFVTSYTSESVVLLDYTYDGSYVMSDYTDITHLNEAAADRMSAQLSASIISLLDERRDQPHIHNVAAESNAQPSRQ